MGITTITPCHGRVQLVKELLASLQVARTAYEGESESVVIDSSETEDAEAIRSLCASYDARYIEGPVNVRVKRMIGIQHALHEHILFIDSDCAAEPTLLCEHQREYEASGEIAGVLGVTRFRGKRTPIWSVLHYSSLLASFSFAERFPYVAWGTCSNLSLKRDIILRVGGFRIDWPFKLGGDDLDLTLRITEEGGLIKSNPAAVVWHSTATWNSTRAVLERAWRWGRMEYHILVQHPTLEHSSAPRPMVVFGFLVVLALVLTGLKGVLPLLVPLIWLLLFLLLFTGLSGHFGGQSPKARRLFPRLLAQLIQLVYESGSIVESLKHGDMRLLYKRLVFSDEQVIQEWSQQVRQVWAVVLASVLLVVIVCAAVMIRKP